MKKVFGGVIIGGMIGILLPIISTIFGGRRNKTDED